MERKFVRRASVAHRSYKDFLREDFKEICGYCGKSEAITKNAFEIDKKRQLQKVLFENKE